MLHQQTLRFCSLTSSTALLSNLFVGYESKPITRMAHCVTEEDVIVQTKEEATSNLHAKGELISFKHYEPVKVGDFIGRLTVEDTYHVSQAVFRERNVV